MGYNTFFIGIFSTVHEIRKQPCHLSQRLQRTKLLGQIM